ncbi:MAG TPA: M1 family aminopeptidase [Longimicrobium sp.]|nr:M1 family aminopeptidase [Longimicrobium sp.]
MRTFAEIFRYELATTLRRPTTWIYFATLLALSVLAAGGFDAASGTLYTAPFRIAGNMLLMAMVGTLVTASLFGDAASRDPHTGMHPLFYSLSIGKGAYLGGRFAGAFVVNAIVVLAIPIGLALSTRSGLVDAVYVGPFRPWAYLQPLFVFVFPNLLINGAFLFGLSLLSRRALPGYLGALALFLCYMVGFAAAAAVYTSPTAAYFDATGLIAASELTSGWTFAEKDTRLVPLLGQVLWNRVLWLAVGIGLIALTWGRFRFAHPAEGGRRARARATTTDDQAAPAPVAVAVPAAPRFFNARARVRQALAIGGAAFREIARSRDFLAVAIGLLVFVLVFGSQLMADRFGVASWPLTQLVAGFLSAFPVGMVVSFLTAFYAGELIWRERDARISEIADAAPLPDWVPFAGKYLALGLLLLSIQGMLLAAGVLLQVTRGFYAIDLGLYVRILFGVKMADYLLLAAVAMLVHALVHNKYLGHLVVVVFYLATTYAGWIGVEHRMLVYGSDPGWVYSDMAGFGPFLAPFFWFKLYWAAWALLFAVVASLFWVRGTETGARWRVRLAGRRFTRPMAAGAAAAVALILSTGGFVFYNTNVLNEYRTKWDRAEERAEYERRYKRFEYLPQPRVTRVQLVVELHPGRGSATTRGTYHLVNATSQPIDSVHVSLLSMVTAREIGFDRPAARVSEDARHGYWIYRLARPLAPGDSLRMRFTAAIAPRRFTNDRMETEVVGNGTFLNQLHMPSIGYQRDFELPQTGTRREHGLPRRDFRPSIHDARARQVARSSSDAGWIELETTIGTDPDQVAVAPGTLRREWSANGRRWFHYRTDAPVLNFYGILSARYEVHESTWNGVRLQLLFHPGHDFNRERMLRSTRASLDYYTRNFGPYPHPQLKLVEFPRYEDFARAYPGMIVFGEGASVLTRVGAGTFDSPFMLTAHEVAHQWWGHQVMGADVQGSQMLSETLAQYGAMMVMEKELGSRPVHQFLQTMHIEYLNRRGTHANPEVPLMLTGDHDHLHYRKGAVAMYALRDIIGEARVNAALRRVVERHGYRGPPFPTTLDLHRELAAVTPDSLRYLLTDLLETITVWDLAATGARAEPAGGGAWRVMLSVRTAKLRSDSVGNHTEVPMNDWVEIGVFGADPNGETLGRPLYLRKHRLRAGQQTVTVTVPGRPTLAGIDPFHKLLTRNKEEMDEKIAEVEVKG